LDNPPQGATAPRHAACAGPIPSSAEGPRVIYTRSLRELLLTPLRALNTRSCVSRLGHMHE